MSFLALPILAMSDERKKNFNRRINKAYVTKLFQTRDGKLTPSREINLPPRGSIVFYQDFFVPQKADKIFELCNDLNIDVPSYKNSRNEVIQQPRASLWFGPVPYNYSKYTLPNHSFRGTPNGWLEVLREDMEMAFNVKLNSCLINLYRNGTDKVDWHADDEFIFGQEPTIVSLSFGITRKFEICQKHCKFSRYPQYSFDLVHGSVIVMKGDMQSNWVHRVPIDRSCDGVRYNLTFRNVDF